MSDNIERAGRRSQRTKCGTHGVYQHCSVKHLHRYLAGFDFRYSNRIKLGVDTRALKGIVGHRLLSNAS
jgi:hypothetical protein